MFTPTTILSQGECKLQCTRARFLMDSAWILYEVFMNREKCLYEKLLRLETLELGLKLVRDRCHPGADR